MNIKGLIVPTERNRHGRPVEIGIETESFDRYIIGHGKRGRELFAHLFCEVEVSGTLIGDSTEGDPILNINEYKINNQVDLTDSTV